MKQELCQCGHIHGGHAAGKCFAITKCSCSSFRTTPPSPQKEIEHECSSETCDLTPTQENSWERNQQILVGPCDRCGQRFQPLGRVLEWGKWYPAATVKQADRTTREIKADHEIKFDITSDTLGNPVKNPLMHLEDVKRLLIDRLKDL